LTNHRIEPILNGKEKFLDDLLSRRKKTTFKGYRRGLELFEKFYQKDFDETLAEAKQKLASEDPTEHGYFDRKIEAFYPKLSTCSLRGSPLVLQKVIAVTGFL
jgi:hypothetical protein